MLLMHCSPPRAFSVDFLILEAMFIYNVITLVNLTLESSVRQPQVFDNLQELNPIVKSLP